MHTVGAAVIADRAMREVHPSHAYEADHSDAQTSREEIYHPMPSGVLYAPVRHCVTRVLSFPTQLYGE